MNSIALHGKVGGGLVLIVGDGLVLIAGASLPLAFAPFGFYFIAPIALAILFRRWQDTTPARAFWRGLLYGVGSFGVGVSWVNHSFYQFGGIPLIGAVALTLLFVLGMALYPAFLGLLVNRFALKNNLVQILFILPLSWTLTEWLRGWFLTGFPWLSVGYSQIDSPLRGFAPLFGVYGVGWLTAVTAGGLVYDWKQKPVGWKMGFLIIVLWSGGELLTRIPWTHAVGEPIKITLLQGNIPQDFKWLENYQAPTLDRYLELSQQNRGADLLIWPETAIPLFYHEIPTVLEKLYAEHHAYQTDFLIGIPVTEDRRNYFNSVFSVSTQPGFYHKRHLVPFGEYVPFRTLLGNLLKLLNVPMSDFSAGPAQQPNLQAANQMIGVSICYEDVFGELIRSSLPEATLLVNVSNDTWFGDSIAPHQHLEIARMRALESGRYLLRATNTGISALLDAHGKVVAQAPQFKITALSGLAQPYQGITPYTRFGNSLIVILLIILLVGSYLGDYFTVRTQRDSSHHTSDLS